MHGEERAVARVVDLQTAVEVLGGKIEFETGEEGREAEILEHLLRVATAQTVSAHFAGIDMALALVGRLVSPERSADVRKYIQYDPAPPF